MKRYITAALAAFSLAVWLGGCGGGVGSGGTGSPMGYAEGSVTGFGSVIVDGTAFDDSRATVQDSSKSETVRRARNPESAW
jgi:hypothetical protein